MAFTLRRFCVCEIPNRSRRLYDRDVWRFPVSPKTPRLRGSALDGAQTLSVPVSQRAAVRREVLVVDDDFSAREVLTELLKDEGY
jgi:hypothetical protein